MVTHLAKKSNFPHKKARLHTLRCADEPFLKISEFYFLSPDFFGAIQNFSNG